MKNSDRLLEKRWQELEDIPFDEIDGKLVLAENWWLFPKGTAREEIWEVFDKGHSKGVYWLLHEFGRWLWIE